MSDPAEVEAAEVELTLLPASGRAEAEAIWRDLEARAEPGLSTSWDWTSTWLDHFGEVVSHRFALGYAGGRACGAALLAEGVGQRRGPFALRTIHLGTAGLAPPHSVYVEYNRLLAEPGHRAAFAGELLRHLRGEPGWDELVLDGFAAADAALLTSAEPRFEVDEQVAPYADLEELAGPDRDVVAGLSKNTRQQVRRTLRGLEGMRGERAASVDEALDVFAELVELHQAKWTAAGEPGAFADPGVVSFHRALIRRVGPERAILYRSRSGQGTVGCLYSFAENGRALFYQGGFAPFEDSKIKPGLATHALCMQDCLDRGLRDYDFLAGESRYKSQLSNREASLVWAVLRRRRLRFELVRLAGRIARR